MDSDQVVICTGFIQGAGLTLAALRQQGHQVVAVEDPGHDAVQMLVRRAGLRLVPVLVDEQGLVVQALAATRATVVMLTPAHQTPTGVVLSAARRRDLVRWAEAAEAVVIEDDYDSEFRYDKQPSAACRGWRRTGWWASPPSVRPSPPPCGWAGCSPRPP